MQEIVSLAYDRYIFPADIDKWAHIKGKTHRPVAKYECHHKACGQLDTCTYFQIGTSASADGSIAVWRDDLSGD